MLLLLLLLLILFCVLLHGFGCFLLFVICCLLFAVCCLLFAVRCSLFAVRCSLFAVRCSLFAVRCSLFAVRCSLFVVRCVLGVVVNLQCGVPAPHAGGRAGRATKTHSIQQLNRHWLSQRYLLHECLVYVEAEERVLLPNCENQGKMLVSLAKLSHRVLENVYIACPVLGTLRPIITSLIGRLEQSNTISTS